MFNNEILKKLVRRRSGEFQHSRDLTCTIIPGLYIFVNDSFIKEYRYLYRMPDGTEEVIFNTKSYQKMDTFLDNIFCENLIHKNEYLGFKEKLYTSINQPDFTEALDYLNRRNKRRGLRPCKELFINKSYGNKNIPFIILSTHGQKTNIILMTSSIQDMQLFLNICNDKKYTTTEEHKNLFDDLYSKMP